MSLISKKHLSMAIQSLKNVFNKKIKESKADWNQNDSSADNYVKNRTHYEEEKFEIILEEQTIEGFALMQEPLYAVEDVFSVKLESNKTYTVVWDGVSYDVEYRELDGLGCLGNENYVNMMGGGDVPFALVFADVIFVVTESNATSHTISITAHETVIHKIDSKYLPEVGVKSWNDLEDRPFGLEETVLFEGNVTTDQYGNYQNNALQAYSATSYITTIGDKQYISTPTYIDPDGTGIFLMDDGEYHGYIVSGYLCLNTDYYPPSSSYYVKLSSAEIQQIDAVLLPDNVATDSDIETVQNNVNNAQTAADNAQATADSKMDANNPAGIGSFSMNRKTDTTVGDYSSTFGYLTVASGNYSHAAGLSTIANFAHMNVHGQYNLTDKIYYCAPVEKIITSGPYYNCYAATTYSLNDDGLFVLTGGGTYELYKVPVGYYFVYKDTANTVTDSSGKKQYVSSYIYYVKASTMSTYMNTITDYYSVALPDGGDSGIYASVVGNGTSNTKRSNAYTLDWNGNAWYSGDVYIGSTSGTHRDDGSKKLTTEEYVRSAKPSFALIDSVTNYEYIIYMQNGNLTSVCKAASIEVTTMPTQTEYMNGEPFNATGMVVTATCQDGTTKIVKDYTYDLVTKDNASAFEIRYTEVDTTYTTTIELTILDVGSSLSDFTYTIEADGTYTLTGWNGTLNGVASTELIIPDSNKINL